MENAPSTHRLAGRACEGMGDYQSAIAQYEQAIAGYETIRSSFSVEDRAAFFCNSVAQKPYWGRIRCEARLVQRKQAEMPALLRACESCRARQFGELTGEAPESSVELTPQNVCAALAPGDLLLYYVLMDRDLLIIAASRDEMKLHLEPLDQKALTANATKAMECLANPKSSIAEIERAFQHMSGVLIEPVRSAVAKAGRIIVVPDGIMTAIPFDLLSLDASRYTPIVEKMPVRQVPSLRWLVSQQQEEPASWPLDYFGVADPSNAPGRAVLAPGARREAVKVSGSFDPAKTKLLLGREASEQAVKSANLAQARYIHFSTHGFLVRDPKELQSDVTGLVLGKSGSEDGMLTAAEVRRLRLDADVCVLSACETGTGTYVPGEGILSLARSFLLAGSRSVAMTQWSVNVDSTEELVVRFFRYRLAGESKGEALRRAKLDLMTAGNATTRPNTESRVWCHPHYWAGFALLGN